MQQIPEISILKGYIQLKEDAITAELDRTRHKTSITRQDSFSSDGGMIRVQSKSTRTSRVLDDDTDTKKAKQLIE